MVNIEGRQKNIILTLLIIAILVYGFLAYIIINNVIKKEGYIDNSYKSSKHIRSLNNMPFSNYISEDIDMPLDHQRYLYDICQKRQLDYIKTLGLIKHESQFDPNAISHTYDYGYMQINKTNHDYLSKKLKTENKPLDPYININWGTYMLDALYTRFEEEGFSGRELDEIVWSAYNKGVSGFLKHGKAERYIDRTDREIEWLLEHMDKK